MLQLVTAQGARVPIDGLAGLRWAARELFAGYGESIAPALERVEAATTVQAASAELAQSTGTRLIVRGPNDLSCLGFVTVEDERLRCTVFAHGHPLQTPTTTKES
ncbi:hypothetical protein B0T42_09995 [Rathayibacter sp. VKM Ac-2630]|nr:hypothetical protein B0T42_09995 [Rathayibacter sp. VKM Ac-2630]